MAFKDLKRLLPAPKGAKVIEVGCGEGSFVSDARVGGFDAEGIELNAAAVRAAVARGIPVRHVDVAEAAAANAGAADAVCAFQVLEHVPEVGAFLESCVRMLKPGGLLVLCVPNAQSYLRDLDVPLDMPPHHMSRWSGGALAALSTVLPVDLEITREEPLRRTHVRAYVAAQAARSRALGRPAWTSGRAARAATMALLYAGLRHLARGQSIYAVLRRRSA